MMARRRLDFSELLVIFRTVKTFLTWGLVLAALIGGGAWYVLSSSEQGSGKKILQTAAVTRGDFVSKVQATGTLEPQELVDVGAQVTGEIKEFGTDTEGRRVDYGSEVKEGQLLARIDDTIVELDIRRGEASVAQAKAQIAQAKASISQSQANKNKADRDLERAKKLGVGDALSQMSYDQYVTAAETAAANFEQAQAQLQSAEAQLQSAEAQLASQLRNREYTHIKSPVDGTIVVRQVNVGQTVVSSMNASTLFLVARDLTHMQIWASVNEADIAKVHPGQEVRYTVDALPNENFTGVVNKIRPNATMSSNVVTYIVEIDIENPDRKLLPYMSANANFIEKEVKDVLMVTNDALSFRPTPDMVEGAMPEPPARPEGEETPRDRDDDADHASRGVLWVKAGENKVRPVRVTRGDTDGTRTVVTPAEGDSLSEQDELVTGVSMMSAAAPAAAQDGNNNLFGPKFPERRKRSTGGVAPKAGQSDKPSGPPAPPAFISLPALRA